MHAVRSILALVTLIHLAAPSIASLVFFRSVPAKGVWAEWKIESNLTSCEECEPKIRLTAGPITERDGRRFQVVEMSGECEDDGKPYPLHARYEVDLEKLEQQGFPRDCIRLIAVYGEDGEPLELTTKNYMTIAAYRAYMLMSLDHIKVDEKTEKLEEPPLLAKYELHVLTAQAATGHFGEGDAPNSGFKAWIGDDVPFGVAKWGMETRLGRGRDRIIVKMNATLTATGTVSEKAEAAEADTVAKPNEE